MSKRTESKERGPSHALYRPELALRTATSRYGLAIAAAALALAVRLALIPVVEDHAPYISFAPAVLLASAFGGFGPGVFATAASVLFVLPTLSSFPALTTAEIVNAFAFSVVGLGMAWFGGRLRQIGLQATAAAEDLLSREAHLKLILDTVPEAMIVIDEQGTIQSFSATAEEVFGYSAAEAIGQNVRLLMPADNGGRHENYIENYLKTGERKMIGTGRTVVAKRRDGSTFPAELTVGEMRSGPSRFFTGFVRDLTEREKTEARMRELQSELTHVSRLTAVGEMASSIAHELNQPLSAIANYLKGLVRLLDGPPDKDIGKMRSVLEAAAEQSLRAGQIIRRLREFLARRESEKRIESISELVRETSKLAFIDTKYQGVRIRFQFDPQIDAVLADKVQIQQVLLNLMRNAIEAMEESDRKELTISTSPAEEGMAAVEVADTGCGITPEIAAQLFQPFATSKPNGMGVGLSISRNIVEAHHGRISAEPNPDGGTIVRFTLRAVGEQEIRDVN